MVRREKTRANSTSENVIPNDRAKDRERKDRLGEGDVAEEKLSTNRGRKSPERDEAARKRNRESRSDRESKESRIANNSVARRKSKSPIRRKSKSPARRKSQSPIRREDRSPPVRIKSKSPARQKPVSPVRRKSRSPPVRQVVCSPSRRRSRSPIRRNSQSKSRKTSRSPNRLVNPASLFQPFNDERHWFPRHFWTCLSLKQRIIFWIAALIKRCLLRIPCGICPVPPWVPEVLCLFWLYFHKADLCIVGVEWASIDTAIAPHSDTLFSSLKTVLFNHARIRRACEK